MIFALMTMLSPALSIAYVFSAYMQERGMKRAGLYYGKQKKER